MTGNAATSKSVAQIPVRTRSASVQLQGVAVKKYVFVYLSIQGTLAVFKAPLHVLSNPQISQLSCLETVYCLDDIEA